MEYFHLFSNKLILDSDGYRQKPKKYEKIKDHDDEKGADKSCSDKPAFSGPCRAYKSMWTYNNGGCEVFLYGGCKGNGNRFKELSECKKMCVNKPGIICMPSYSLFSNQIKKKKLIIK